MIDVRYHLRPINVEMGGRKIEEIAQWIESPIVKIRQDAPSMT